MVGVGVVVQYNESLNLLTCKEGHGRGSDLPS